MVAENKEDFDQDGDRGRRGALLRHDGLEAGGWVGSPGKLENQLQYGPDILFMVLC